ncbi:MAG: BlaI/MecI/CopY family transcriptional regulator [bacterium]|nr:BlaI/MecI/CopY family transcriptional regulator [bacterium]
MSKTDPNPTLTEFELEIMHVIWELGSCTVRQVYEVLLERKKIAYTTVMTMMNILDSKGHLSKHKAGRAFVYQPVQTKSAVISGLVEDFVSRVFQGSAQPLVLSLVKDRKLSEDDLEEISRMIKETE